MLCSLCKRAPHNYSGKAYIKANHPIQLSALSLSLSLCVCVCVCVCDSVCVVCVRVRERERERAEREQREREQRERERLIEWLIDNGTGLSNAERAERADCVSV